MNTGDQGSVIENVTLIKIRSDGSQRYYWDEPNEVLSTSTWLEGHSRASNVVVGDTGRLIYVNELNGGLYRFHKYGCKCQHCFEIMNKRT